MSNTAFAVFLSIFFYFLGLTHATENKEKIQCTQLEQKK